MKGVCYMHKKLYSCSVSLALLFNAIVAPFAPLVVYADENKASTVEKNLYQVGVQDGEIVLKEGEGIESDLDSEFQGTGSYFHVVSDTNNVLLFSSRARATGYVEELYRISNTSYDLNHLVSGWKTSKGIPRLKARLGNEIYTPFCIEPGVMHETGGNMDATDYYTNLTNQQKEQLDLILKYGYGNNGDTSDDSYVMTQVAIWEVVTGVGMYSEIWGRLVQHYPARSELYHQLSRDIESDGIIPSFLDQKTKSQEVELKWDGKAFTATLEDKNGVLSKYTEISGNGQIEVKRSGNKITLSTTNPNASTTFTMTQKQTSGGKTLFWESSKQNLISGGSTTPHSLSIKATIRTLGNLTVAKKGVNGEFVPNTTFKISGMGIEKTIKTGSDGIATLSDLEAGTYTVTEVEVPAPYLLDSTPKKVTVEVAKTAYLDFVNQVAKGQIVINKTGEQLTKVEQKNGEYEFIYEQQAMSDVTFSIYAKKDIVDSSGKVLYQANELVERVTTNKDGKATSSQLPLGDYYVKEISAPSGMVVSEQTMDVTLTYKNSQVALTTEIRDLENIHQKVEISLQKVGETVNNGYQPLGDVVFGIYNKEDIKLSGHVVVPANTLIKKITTTQDGKGSITTDLPIGSYYVKEISAPEGYHVKNQKYEFEFNGITQNDLLVQINVNSGNVITNELIRGSVVVTKYNQDQQPLANAILEVYTENGSLVETLTTDESGKAQTSDLIYGSYYIKELHAPTGYRLSDETISFKIRKNGEVIQTELINYPTRTEIDKYDPEGNKLFGATMQIINQSGEVVEEWKTTDETKVVEGLPHGDYILREITAPDTFQKILDVPFTVTDENKVTVLEVTDELTRTEINKYDHEGNKLFGATMQIINQAGEVVEEWETTDETKVIEGLPHGDYVLREITAPDTFQKILDVPFTVTDEHKVTVLEVTDELTRVEIDKYDPEGNKLFGATMQIINQAGEVVEEWETNEETKVVEGLPHGDYILREITAPNGFQKILDVPFTVTDEHKVTVLEVIDELTRVEIDKYDPEGNKLFGATMQVINEAGEVVEEWKTTDETKVIEGLPHGKYILREITAPSGFQKVLDIEFEVTDEHKVTVLEVTDELTRVEIDKYDPEGNKLFGATMQIINEEGEVMTEWQTTDETKVVEGLPHGDYILREITAPSGFQKILDVPFTVTDEHKVTVLEVTDELTRVEIDKYDPEGNKLFGATMQIINEAGEVVEEWETTDETKVVEGLPHGDYILREITAPDTFQKILDVPFTVTDENKVTVLEVTDELTRVEIDKYDPEGNKLFGAIMQIINEAGEVIEEWETNDETKVIEGLSHGKYILREITAPDTFQKILDIEFEVTDENKVTVLEVTDELTRVEINKYDHEGNKLFGATMQIINEAGDVIEEWETTDETKVVEGLPYGDYILREITAPSGFQKILDVPFTVTDEHKVTVLEVTDELTKTIVHKVDPEGNYVAGAVLHLLTSSGELVKEFKTITEPIEIVGLAKGDYILREIKAPRGYLEAEDIQFAVTDEPQALELIMIDELEEKDPSTGFLGPVTGLGDFKMITSTIAGLALVGGGVWYYIKKNRQN